MTFDTIPSDSTTTLGCATLRLHCLSFPPLSQLLTPRIGFVFPLSLVIIILAVQYATSPWRKVPPGPNGFPVLGNAFQLKDKRWMFEKDCKKKFRTSNSIFATP